MTNSTLETMVISESFTVFLVLLFRVEVENAQHSPNMYVEDYALLFRNFLIFPVLRSYRSCTLPRPFSLSACHLLASWLAKFEELLHRIDNVAVFDNR